VQGNISSLEMGLQKQVKDYCEPLVEPQVPGKKTVILLGGHCH
jgi:hypothetical protein